MHAKIVDDSLRRIMTNTAQTPD